MIILKNNLKRIFLEKSNFMFLFIIPIIFSIFLLKNKSEITSASIGIYNEDNGEIINSLIENIKKDFKVVEISKESDIEKSLLTNSVDVCLVLNAGFEEGVIKGEISKAQLIEIKDRNDIKFTNNTLEYILNKYASVGISSKGSKEVMIETLKDIGGLEHNIEDISNGKGTRRDASLAMGFIAVSIMSISFFGFIIEDKEEERFERFMTTPMSIKSYHIQNLLTYFLVTVVSTLILLIYQINRLGVNIKGASFTIFSIFVLLSLVCTAECIFISSISKNSTQFYSIQTLIYTPSVLLSGCYFPRNIMPSMLQNVSNIVPATWALKATDKVVYSGANIFNLWVEILILMLLSIVFFLLASWRKKDLLI